MAQLDPLLDAVVDRDAEELILVEGERPAILQAGTMRPVSPRTLNRAQIGRLLSELSDRIDAQRLASAEPVSFEYNTPGGNAFLCETQPSEGGLRVRLAPQPLGGGFSDEGSAPFEATSQTAFAHPASTAQPGEPAPATPTAPAAVAVPQEGVHPIDRFLLHMVRDGCSDLHLSAEERPVFRRDGDIERHAEEPVVTGAEVLTLLLDIMPERNRTEFEETHDTDFAYEIPDLARFRVNVFRDRKGVSAVFRQIPSKILTAEQLGVPESVLKLCHLTKGLVLVTGPTGSGKSTTLAAMIDHINRERPDHIITIEDPIEFVHRNQRCLVNQREVSTHTRSFKAALRAALREDPDIVLVGELRDLETIAIAIETAETGHLVFGTLHTNTACSTIDRVIDQFPADRQAQIRTMLSESLRGVISQQLLKKIGGGRVAALEVLVVTSAIANMIREGKTFQIPSLMQTGKSIGMRTMTDALLDLVRTNQVDPHEALRRATEKTVVEKALQKMGHDVRVEEDS